MDIYRSRSNWKIIFGVIGAIILIVTVVYSNFLANQLEQNERKNTFFYKDALDKLTVDLSSADGDWKDEDLMYYQNILDSFSLPVILVGEDGTLSANNWGEEKDNDENFLQEKVDNYKSGDAIRLQGTGYAKDIYIFNSPTLTAIRYFPVVQIILISVFVLFAYFLFNASRRAEQNRVWAGMAKETAHQLGTPISAILGWIEHLKLMTEGDEDQSEVLEELIKDVDRLELVADRFSKIGSAPDLVPVDIVKEVDKCRLYMERRSPRKVDITAPSADKGQHYAMINEHLFDWVIENLMRNALDAMDGKGIIASEIRSEGDHIQIDISDTGKGIPASKFKSVFKPGYSTKQRGWGLGLSLAKRIIEDYHKGKIYVKSSKVGEGTTFTIILQKALSNQ